VPETLSLAEASIRTGVPEWRLESWCALGVVSCERPEGEWLVSADELAGIRTLDAVGVQLSGPDDQQVIVFAYPSPTDATRASRLVQEQLRLAATDASSALVSIDGKAVPVVSIRGRMPLLETAARLATQLGGRVLLRFGHASPVHRTNGGTA
jgi:hypothetical protein